MSLAFMIKAYSSQDRRRIRILSIVLVSSNLSLVSEKNAKSVANRTVSVACHRRLQLYHIEKKMTCKILLSFSTGLVRIRWQWKST